MSSSDAPSRREEQWIVIQHKTFVNWANEQLIHSNRSVENLGTDLCNGVKLVALIEALQFRKIGKVYANPSNRIQMLYNVALALQAVADDNVKLVNIGTDDIVGGNLKLILGLLWHLIIRYQISSNKAKAPPKKLMLSWFQNVLPGLSITDFTTHWKDGIALHALLDLCKPGLSPNWHKLSPKDSIQNCSQAMQLAKDHLGIPKVISAEDFCSPNLDELSAMTYLSYFIRKDSAGYFETLNWAIKQLKITNISNLTTDWNDGYYLCALVHSLGGEVKGWPNIDRRNHVATCQLGLDSAKKLGVEPMFTAAELADPSLDHLTLMAYLSKFRRIKSKRNNADRLVLECSLQGVRVGKMATFKIIIADKDSETVKVAARVSGPTSNIACKISWENKVGICSFQPTESGSHQLVVTYDGEAIKGCPLNFNVHSENRIKVTGNRRQCRVGQPFKIQVICSNEECDSVQVWLKNPSGELKQLSTVKTSEGLESTFEPSFIGAWEYQIHVDGEKMTQFPVDAYDPGKAFLIGPEHGIVGGEITCTVNIRDCGGEDVEAEVLYNEGKKLENVKSSLQGDVWHITFVPNILGRHSVKALVHGESISGSPKNIEVIDPGLIRVSGEGLSRGTKGVEAYFTVNKGDLEGDITADVNVSGQRVPCRSEIKTKEEIEFCYVPSRAGVYTINVYWENKLVAGSPISSHVTDRSRVTITDNLKELKDDSDRLALEYNKTTKLNFDVSQAGPGTFTAEVLSPGGKLPVDVVQTTDRATVSFVATYEGDHYIHLYWSQSPTELSPLLAYCPGPPLPVDDTKVIIKGKGAESGRATVPAEFIIDGRRAGPGVPKVRMQGIQAELPVEISPLKYDRYKCTYLSNIPGSFLLYVYWSGQQLQMCPLKVAVGARGEVKKVKVTGEINDGISNNEIKIFIDTREAGPGEVTAECHSHRQSALCDIKETLEGQYTLRIVATEPEKHVLQIRYDGQHVPGSPFILRISEAPDPTKVRVVGPGVEHGLIGSFKSQFLVDTQGAGAGQLSVKIRGPRGGFKVDMSRESNAERTVNCRYDPREVGEYVITIRWSGVDVPGSPFTVHIVDTMEELFQLTGSQDHLSWRADI